MSHYYHIGKGNTKTGPIPTTTTGSDSCPNSCPLKEKGCYASYSFLGSHWKKVTSGERGIDYNEFIRAVKAFPVGQLWRHNQAGDLPSNGETIDTAALSGIVRANKGKRGFTYTHHDMRIPSNMEAIVHANANGFTVNLSCNDAQQASKVYKATGLPVVTLLPQDAPNRQTVDGVNVVACPAEKSDRVQCSNCALCANPSREYIIGFRAHGTAKKHVNLIAKG